MWIYKAGNRRVWIEITAADRRYFRTLSCGPASSVTGDPESDPLQNRRRFECGFDSIRSLFLDGNESERNRLGNIIPLRRRQLTPIDERDIRERDRFATKRRAGNK